MIKLLFHIMGGGGIYSGGSIIKLNKPQNQCHREDPLLYAAGVVHIYKIQFVMMIDST